MVSFVKNFFIFYTRWMSLRLFFGASVIAPWQFDMPISKEIKEEMRHITLGFLGNRDEFPSSDLFPKPPFSIGTVGKASLPIFLPPHHPRVTAYKLDFFDDRIVNYQKKIAEIYQIEDRSFLPHITIARSLIEKEKIRPTIFYIDGIHLYESLGNLEYRKRFSYDLIPPFAPLSHTADLAFLVRGESFSDLYIHALIAIAFQFSHFIDYIDPKNISSFEDLIFSLNQIVSQLDIDMGSPIKAVTYHGSIKTDADIMEWEMILDV